ncbi:tyrosine-type recombinase/integrase [Atopobium fossor]|uniref:tyrosine-type recombinase/integrase n=1 Tax=Atopobium fossor TaxID=39487 RepID=UPI00040CB7C3|nr:site-specific integrase [Atopobium fossor]
MYVSFYVRKEGKYWRGIAQFKVNEKWVQRSVMTNVPCNATDNTGKRKAKQYTQTWFNSLNIAKVQSSNKSSNHVLWEYLTKWYESKVLSNNIEETTMNGYELYIKYVRHYFQNKTVEESTPDDVEGFISYLRDEQQLSPNTVKKAYNVLKAGFKHAVASRIIDWSPCEPVATPKQISVLPNPLDEPSRRVLIARLNDIELTQEVVATWIAYYTGMRRGEVCGLRWGDIQLAGTTKVMHVRRSVGVGRKGTYVKSTKTNKDRVVPVPPELAKLLNDRRTKILEECLNAGVAFSPDLYVCGYPDGRYLNPHNLTHWWTAHSKEWGLVGTQNHRPTFHDLRHTYATVAVRALNIKTAQDILGHSDISMTMRYADTDLSQIVDAAGAMDKALSAPSGDVVKLDNASNW